MTVPRGSSVLERLFNEQLANLADGAIVPDVTVLVVRVPWNIAQKCNLQSNKIYITARALQHIRERRGHEEFTFIANNIWAALKHPSIVYENVKGKRGEYLFVKEMGDNGVYACSIGTVLTDTNNEPKLYISTAFKNTRGNYFKKCKPLWSRKDGTPSS